MLPKFYLTIPIKEGRGEAKFPLIPPPEKNLAAQRRRDIHRRGKSALLFGKHSGRGGGLVGCQVFFRRGYKRELCLPSPLFNRYR